jgi:thiol-disulfide isomerase/thioredoxin
MKKNKVSITIFFFSLLLMLLISPLRGYVSIMSSSLVGFIAYFILTNYFLHKFKSQLKEVWIVIVILAGLSILQLPNRILDFQSTMISLPDFLIHCLGILIGFLYYKSDKIIGVTVTALAMCFILYVFFEGYERWIHYLNYGTFYYTVSEEVPEFNLIQPNGKIFTKKDLYVKTVVFDFWSTGCGVCFRQFPVLQEKYIKYSDTPGVEFYAVNIPMRSDSIGVAEKIMSEYPYSFPILIARNDSLAKLFKVFCFPTVIIIRNGKEIVFRGDIEGVDAIIEKIKPANRQ